MLKHALLLRDYSDIEEKVAPVNPSTFYLAARLEQELGLDYF